MPHHIPTKEEMIEAVRKNGCPNLLALPLADMTAADIYTHLLEAKCPCLRKLMEKKKEKEN